MHMPGGEADTRESFVETYEGPPSSNPAGSPNERCVRRNGGARLEDQQEMTAAMIEAIHRAVLQRSLVVVRIQLGSRFARYY